MATESATDFALREACTQEGCPICRLVARAGQRYVDFWGYESNTDIGVIHTLDASGGFCDRHTEMAIAQAVALPLARLSQRLLRRQRELLVKPALTTPRQPCPACQAGSDWNAWAIAALTEAITHETTTLIDAFAASGGMCPDHGTQTLQRCTSPAARQRLIALQDGILARLAAEIEQVIDAFDYRNGGAPQGPSGNAWKRVSRLLSSADRWRPS